MKLKQVNDPAGIDLEEFSSVLSYPAGEPGFVSAKGCYLYSSTGESYLDGCAGTFNINLGYGHPEVVKAVSGVIASGLTHLSSSFRHELVEAAAAALVEVAPGAISHCHFKGSSGGSTAVEQAVRHAWVATGKRSIATFRHSHHGQTIATTSLSGMPFRCNRLPTGPLPVVRVEAPDCYRCPFGKEPSSCGMECIAAIERALDCAPTGEDDVAAFVAEPILGAGGGIAPPKHWWGELQQRLWRRRILLVLDEVQTFGRTGSFFAADYYDLAPDMVALAKGISGIGIPGAGALLMTKELRLLNSAERSLTWAGSVLTSAAVHATVNAMKAPGFFESTQHSADVLRERLLAMQNRFECIGTVRGFGLMTGLELVKSRLSREPDPELTERVLEVCMENRLLLRNSLYGRGSFIKVRPPLVITVDEVHELCNRLERSFVKALQS